MKKPISYPGGKHHQVPFLIQLSPPHRLYIEPYVGGGSLYFAKEPSKKEIVSELHPEVVAHYQFLKRGTDDDFETLRNMDWTSSRERFEHLRDNVPKSLLLRAFRYFYLARNSMIGDRRSFMPSAASPPALLNHLEEYRKRLKNTIVLRQDAFKVSRKYDVKDSFHYLDPPSGKVSTHPTKSRLFAHPPTIQELLDLMKSLKGNALLTYSVDVPGVEQAATERKLPCKVYSFRGFGGTKKGLASVSMWFIANYPFLNYTFPERKSIPRRRAR